MNATRRRFFALLTTLPFLHFFPAVTRRFSKTLQPTPPCNDHDELTPPLEEGPFFAPCSTSAWREQ